MKCGIDQTFQNLKIVFTTAAIMIHPYFLKPFFLESDTSDYALGAVLSQNGEDGRLHPISFHSWKFTTVEIKYIIHDKELLPLSILSKSGDIFLKELSIQLQSTPITRTSSISCLLEY
jgi:hypothetical protein